MDFQVKSQSTDFKHVNGSKHHQEYVNVAYNFYYLSPRFNLNYCKNFLSILLFLKTILFL